MEVIPIDNKVGENYFGQMTNQLRAKGRTAFKAISERLVLKSNVDIAFADGAERMLRDKELKNKQQGRIYSYFSRVRLGRGSKSLQASKNRKTQLKTRSKTTDQPTNRPTNIASYRVA